MFVFFVFKNKKYVLFYNQPRKINLFQANKKLHFNENPWRTGIQKQKIKTDSTKKYKREILPMLL